MSITAPLPHIQWHEGMLLSPQHFQQESARVDSLIAWQVMSTNSLAWGIKAFELDEKKIKEKSKQWMEIIDGAVENAKDKTLDDAIDLMAKYKNKLKKYRTCGLEKGGEYSYENLVFKVLRRNGYLSKLVDFKNDYVDKSLSLEQEKFE
jgi:hypothetical protein